MNVLATCCRGTPRVANRILRRMRDFAQIYGDDVITLETVKFGLGKLEIDEMGLEAHDRELLRAIIEKYGGGPVGLETLAVSIGEDSGTRHWRISTSHTLFNRALSSAPPGDVWQPLRHTSTLAWRLI